MLPTILKIANYEGESTIKGFEKTIDVRWFDHEISMPMVNDTTANLRVAGKSTHSPMKLGMRFNTAYPKLVSACASGKCLDKAELKLLNVTNGQASVVTAFTLTNVFVSRVRSSNTTDPNKAAEGEWCEVDLTYSEISFDYKASAENGGSGGTVASGPLVGVGK
ncbi:Hcp family type VI secretion system effector [Variovorax saccharolyticus]|uniref:Hcp family type VI secretion system effector n=1 Tax=Variovorax saccharolyticus TaxID=3053516 RepID=UPI0025763F0B|nr:type VI secretion system tube protein Hcp [Variovorax sp. J31P216]MDM0029798.1 type VI secretion system tube protein Hcp [Variovorax sp. J31P216]